MHWSRWLGKNAVAASIYKMLHLSLFELSLLHEEWYWRSPCETYTTTFNSPALLLMASLDICTVTLLDDMFVFIWSWQPERTFSWGRKLINAISSKLLKPNLWDFAFNLTAFLLLHVHLITLCSFFTLGVKCLNIKTLHVLAYRCI